MSLPKVAIVGRPNVGKSSLFNWLVGRRIAVVDATAGVTRDRVTHVVQLDDRFFELIDTGGMGIQDSRVFFFKVRDRYETYFDYNKTIPYKFVRRVEEGGHKFAQDYFFDHEKNIVDNGKGKKFHVPENIQDMISSFYYARTIDFSNAKKGDVFTIQSFVDNEVYPLRIKYMGTEQKEIDLATFNCMKFVPVVQKGRIFKAEEDLTVWVTNDKNKIPIMAEAKILVGSIKMELTNYTGLAHPVAVSKN